MARSDDQSIEFVPGNRYNFHTRDGTCYDGAIFMGGHPSEGVIIRYGIAVVGIGPNEYDWADDYTGSDDATDYFK